MAQFPRGKMEEKVSEVGEENKLEEERPVASHLKGRHRAMQALQAAG